MGSGLGRDPAALDILATDLELDRAPDADQEVSAQGFNGRQQARAVTDPAIGLDQGPTGTRCNGAISCSEVVMKATWHIGHASF